ncbi:heavy metal-binding domain-containing protein [Cellulomonas massiliensis]|jgi:uncharacterized protein YbjQ (UPF0145 family)|uniref:heavy metal-binding domain-containing protein n=1 Tax=Cellulomonas massiliensis TaxID=1465811 RepID=UPI0002F82ECF|nr:heavy metal-binding domain-containing protein [Cellulomonas massiliensis]
MIVVTTDELPGHRITAVLGEVMGLRTGTPAVSLSRAFGSIGQAESPDLTRASYDMRRDAVNRLVAEAAARGANAVVGLRMDTAAAEQHREILAYGTAVVVEPVDAGS